jgi:hypothetical protein
MTGPLILFVDMGDFGFVKALTNFECNVAEK